MYNMTNEGAIGPISNLLFDSTKIYPYLCNLKIIENTTKYEISKKCNQLAILPYELGNILSFYDKDNSKTNNIESLEINSMANISISDIISCDVIPHKKRIGETFVCVLKMSDTEIIVVEAKKPSSVHELSSIILDLKEKTHQINQTKEITITTKDITKTISINPYSPISQQDEEIISMLSIYEVGYLITNYRLYRNNYLHGSNQSYETYSLSLTHDEYEDVIATNVERRMETDTIGGTESRPSMLNFIVNTNIHYNQDTHHSSSVESETGNIVFMNEGKQVMIWRNFSDPNSIVQQINSIKSHYNKDKTEVLDNAKSKESDPVQILKMRFAKGEITKDEFIEMKKMLE